MMGWMRSPSRALWHQKQHHKLQKYCRDNAKLQNPLLQENVYTCTLKFQTECNVTSVNYIYDGNRKYFHLLQCRRCKFTVSCK